MSKQREKRNRSASVAESSTPQTSKSEVARVKSSRRETESSGETNEEAKGLPPQAWFSIRTGYALAGALLLWGAQPPLQLPFLGWIALVPWYLLVLSSDSWTRRDFLVLWIAASLHWLALLQGIRLAYWPLYLGWVALSLYVAVYVPLALGLTRAAIRYWKIPPMLAAPVVWIGIELVRGYMITGFSAALLGHSQVRFPMAMQIADQFGMYGVSGVLVATSMFLAQCIDAIRHRSSSSDKQVPVKWLVRGVAAVALIGATLGYGYWRLGEADQLQKSEPALLKVALIQENAETMFESTADSREEAFQRYINGTRRATNRFGRVDLVIWPESVFARNEPVFIDRSGGVLPAELAQEGVTLEDLSRTRENLEGWFAVKSRSVAVATIPREKLSEVSVPPPPTTHAIVGTDVMEIHADQVRRSNAAVWITPQLQVGNRYDKMHLVMFGEYFPLDGFFGIMYSMFGMPRLAVGENVVAFEIGKTRLAPSICFESTVPHLIAWQVRTLKAKGEDPDVLVNITNDGWFRGSSILDIHLACAVGSAIENRRPILIAANTGKSAWIDGSGRLIAVGNAMAATEILATPQRDHRWGLYQTIADAPAWLCAFFCALLLIPSWRNRREK